MKGLLFIIGGIAAVAWLSSKEQPAAAASPNSTVTPTAHQVPATHAVLTGGGGGGGGGDLAPRDTPFYPTAYEPNYMDEFDLLDLITRSQQRQTYRQEYPDAPGVIDASGFEQ